MGRGCTRTSIRRSRGGFGSKSCADRHGLLPCERWMPAITWSTPSLADRPCMQVVRVRPVQAAGALGCRDARREVDREVAEASAPQWAANSVARVNGLGDPPCDQHHFDCRSCIACVHDNNSHQSTKLTLVRNANLGNRICFVKEEARVPLQDSLRRCSDADGKIRLNGGVREVRVPRKTRPRWVRSRGGS